MKHIAQMLGLLLLIGSFTACSSDSDAEDTAEALADRLTDALDFEGGTVKEGEPPEGDSDSDAPQVAGVTGDDLRLGAPFVFSLTSDFQAAETVNRVVVFVSGSTKYIEVDAGLIAKKTELFGRLREAADLGGKSFVLEFALQTESGVTGFYQTFNVDVSDESAHELSLGEEIVILSAEGETSHDSGRPEGNAGAEYPQINSLSGPSSLAEGESFILTLETSYTESISKVLITTPGNDAYKEVPASIIDGRVTVSGQLNTTSDSRAKVIETGGYSLTFLLALVSDSGVGLYRSWRFEVVNSAADGDADALVDGDMEADTEVEMEADGDMEVDAEMEADAEVDVEADGDADTESVEAFLTWITIPEGEFSMGCPIEDTYNCEYAWSPPHNVTISSFQISAYEVTEEQYTAVMGENPSYPGNCPTCPVNGVNWNMADAFCQAIDARLPSEAEWEYAARAGTTSYFTCGDDSSCLDGIAWWNGTSEGSTHPVGEKTRNAFGLYDMIGNVREWTADCWHANYEGAPTTGEAWMDDTCEQVVERGGSWGGNPVHLYVYRRDSNYKTGADSKFGVRCARYLDSE